MCSFERKLDDDLPGLSPKGSPLIRCLILLQSGPTVKIAVDLRESGEVRSQQDKRVVFANVTTVLPLRFVWGGDTGPFRDQKNHAPTTGPRTP
jgi:hypothetical protein